MHFDEAPRILPGEGCNPGASEYNRFVQLNNGELARAESKD